MGKPNGTLTIAGVVYNLVPATKATETTAPKYVCGGDGTKPCYKAGHRFSGVGMFGSSDGSTKGHSQLNPTHVVREA